MKQEEITKAPKRNPGSLPRGLGPSHVAGAVVSQKKTFVVAKGW